MTLGLLFWILVILWVVFWGAWIWAPNTIGNFGPQGNSLLILVLFVLLGWHAFGPPLHP